MDASKRARQRCPPRSAGSQKQHQWPGLKAIGKVVRVRETAEKTTTETAYYLLSARWRRRQGFVRPVVLQDAISVVDNARF